MNELLLTREQIRGLSIAMQRLPRVEQLRVTMPSEGIVEITDWRRNRRSIITRNGSIYHYVKETDGKST